MYVRQDKGEGKAERKASLCRPHLDCSRAYTLLSIIPVSCPLSPYISLGASFSVLCTRYSRFVVSPKSWCGGGPPRPPPRTQLLAVSRLACAVHLVCAHAAHLLPPLSQIFYWVVLLFCSLACTSARVPDFATTPALLQSSLAISGATRK